MADPVHLQSRDRAAYGGRPRRLTRMGRRPQAKATGRLVHRREGLGRVQMFRAADTNADDALIQYALDFRQGQHRLFRAVITDQIGDQPDFCFRHPVQALADRPGQPLGLQALTHEAGWREKHLGIADILPRQIPRHRLGDEGEIVVGADKAILPNPYGDKIRKVLVGQALTQIGLHHDIWVATVFLHQLPQRRQRNGAFKVQVQFNFRHGLGPRAKGSKIVGHMHGPIKIALAL